MLVREAYVGEYACGKSENAVNRALFLKQTGKPVTLADLDLVEPFYTLRPLKEKLDAMGIRVVARRTAETVGLGETGMLLLPEQRWVLKETGHVILDVGYGVSGTRVLNLLEGVEESGLVIIAVINVARPMTSTLESVIEHLQSLGRVDGLLNNSNLGDETDLEIIRRGAEIVAAAGKKLGIPVVATAADERFWPVLGDRDHLGNPVRYLKRFMPGAFW